MTSFFIVTLYIEKVLMIILIKNEGKVWYKITLRTVGRRKWIELGLERIGREGVDDVVEKSDGVGDEKFFNFFKF